MATLAERRAAKAERRAARERAERAGTLARGALLDRLAKGGRACPAQHRRAARACENLFERAAGGNVIRALDWMRERVDGGGVWREPDTLHGGNANGAARMLMMIRLEVGAASFEVLRRFVGVGESIAGIALDFEIDASAKKNGACSRRTCDHVSRLLSEGLSGAARVLYSNGNAEVYDVVRVIGWSAEGVAGDPSALCTGPGAVRKTG